MILIFNNLYLSVFFLLNCSFQGFLTLRLGALTSPMELMLGDP